MMSHAATCPACLLELSDERDRALRARLNAWRAGYRAAVNAVADVIGGRIVPDRPSEIERRRYPPDGRAGWLLPEGGGQVQDGRTGERPARGTTNLTSRSSRFADPAKGATARSDPQ
jgi:hypothetical protein